MKEKFAEDGRKFLSTGEMDSCTGSFFTRNKAEAMSVAAGLHVKFTLTEEVDEGRLRAALCAAVRACPYVAYSLRFNEKAPRLAFVDADGKFPVFCGCLPKSYDEKELEGHFGFVSFSGRELAICLCHVITDGYGFLQFANVLFDAYFDASPQAKWTERPDWAADVMKYPWPLPESREPLPQEAGEHFRLPQAKKGTGGLHRHCFIDRKSFNAFRRDIGLSRQGAAAYLLARALQATHPENGKPIRIRCPINTRTVLGVPHTFQNASVPHMYLSFFPKTLLSKMTKEEARRINGEIYRQLSYEYAAGMTNIFADAAKSGNKADFDNVISDYVQQSELCASYIGGAAGGAMPKAVADVAFPCDALQPFPVMLYFWELGEKISVQYNQSFGDPSYWKSLAGLLGRLT